MALYFYLYTNHDYESEVLTFGDDAEHSTWAQLYNFVKASHKNVFLRHAPHSLTALLVIHPEFIAITDRLCFMRTTRYPIAGPSDSVAAE